MFLFILLQFGKTEEDIENVDNIVIDPLGLLFIIFFVIILFIQFIGMLIHRWGTFMHLIALTEIPNPCKKSINDGDAEAGLKMKATDFVELCENLICEPMPDYPSDTEEEEEFNRKEREIKKQEIIQQGKTGTKLDLRASMGATGGGVRSDWLRYSAGTTLGQSYSDHLNASRRPFSNRESVIGYLRQSRSQTANFQHQQGMELVNRIRRPADEQTSQNNIVSKQRNFGTSAPFQKDILEKMKERNIIDKVPGLRQSMGNPLSMSFRPGAGNIPGEDEDEDIYDTIPAGNGTMGRHFSKLIQMQKKQSQKSRNGGIRRNSSQRNSRVVSIDQVEK